jgi:hypothetical protein
VFIEAALIIMIAQAFILHIKTSAKCLIQVCLLEVIEAALILTEKMFHAPLCRNGLLIKWEKCNLVVKVL